MSKDWIYRLAKNELVRELQTLIDASGTAEDLRRRLSQFVSQNPEMYRTAQPEEKVAERPPAASRPLEESISSEPTAKAIDQIRKWGCHFDRKDPVAFLERVGVKARIQA